MKCSPVKFFTKTECPTNNITWKIKECHHKIRGDSNYLTKCYKGYSYSFIKQMLQHPQKSPNVSVKNIQLPEDFLRPKNFGYSLDKWSSKTPRLKSESYHERKICHRFEDYDDNICDVTEILESLESTEESLREESTDRDIEELWIKSERSSEHPVERRKSKKKKKETVKFSLSRPASPQTEQVIRVDVSSSIPLGDLKRLGGVKGDEIEDDIDMNGIHSKTWEIEERDLIFRCSQLALARKQR